MTAGIMWLCSVLFPGCKRNYSFISEARYSIKDHQIGAGSELGGSKGRAGPGKDFIGTEMDWASHRGLREIIRQEGYK